MLSPLSTACSTTFSPTPSRRKMSTHRPITHHPPQRAGPDQSPTALWPGKEAGATAGMQGCSSHLRRGCGLGCPAFKHQKQKSSGPQFPGTCPCGDARHACTHPAAPHELLECESKMLDAAYISEERTGYSITVLRTALKLF